MRDFRTCHTFSLALLACFLLAGCLQPAAVSNQPETCIDSVDRLLQQAVDAGKIPGAVIRIQLGETILHRKAYGDAQKYGYGMRPLEEPEVMTADHLFDLASLTKVGGTTFGIMLLAGQEKLQLDDPVHKWLPEFNSGDKKKITVRHLLSHTAGLQQWHPLYYQAANRSERYQAVATMPLRWPVGEERHYSDLGFMLLGDIIEQISGQPLDEFLHQHLFAPLDLQHTAFNPLDRGFRQIAATSHGNPFEKQMVHDASFGFTVDVAPDAWNGWRTHTLRGEVNDGNAWHADGGVAGHAGLFSTADDLQKLVTLLLNKGNFRGTQFIPEEVVATFLRRDGTGNALGWAMEPKAISAAGTPEGTFGHTGFTGTSITVMPTYQLSIILLTNRQNAGTQENGYYPDLGELRQGIVDRVLEAVRQQADEKTGFFQVEQKFPDARWTKS